MAKDYVRSKKHIQKFMLMRTQLQGVGLQLQVSIYPRPDGCAPPALAGNRHACSSFATQTRFSSSTHPPLQTMKSADAMRNAMRNATVAMVAMNRRMNLPQLQAIMRGFAMETERMDMTQVRHRGRTGGAAPGEKGRASNAALQFPFDACCVTPTGPTPVTPAAGLLPPSRTLPPSPVLVCRR